eukprot:TRINITY_DN1495_c0_g1_i1.p1 TRINITY_DN1495_c0_g1~~TRINITY_DN1495_c0_g1_i1.p1  ORF type:complete len:181 (-),score=38.12 TRINITY_DN1495_c0_g1_i1:27-569(-)
MKGQRLGSCLEIKAGPGTFIRKDVLYAACAGIQKTTKAEGEIPTISVEQIQESTIVPEIGSIVIGKVTKITTRFANVSIECVGSQALRDSYQGMIRLQDVRSTEVDKIQIHQCFRPGDVVRAEVISLGDSRSYYLSTAKNEYGVIFARSEAGATMIPISWEEFVCPKTGMKEKRKVAKVE